MKTTAYITRLGWGGFGLVIWGGQRNGVLWNRAGGGWPNPQAACFAAVWHGRAESVWYDGRRMW